MRRLGVRPYTEGGEERGNTGSGDIFERTGIKENKFLNNKALITTRLLHSLSSMLTVPPRKTSRRVIAVVAATRGTMCGRRLVRSRVAPPIVRTTVDPG